MQYCTNYSEKDMIDKLNTFSINNIKESILYITNNPGRYSLLIKNTKKNNVFILIHPSNRNRQWYLKVENNLIIIDTKLTIGKFIELLYPVCTIFIILNCIIHFDKQAILIILLMLVLLGIAILLGKLANKKINKTLNFFVAEIIK